MNVIRHDDVGINRRGLVFILQLTEPFFQHFMRLIQAEGAARRRGHGWPCPGKRVSGGDLTE